jgi:hypothetical protein
MKLDYKNMKRTWHGHGGKSYSKLMLNKLKIIQGELFLFINY